MIIINRMSVLLCLYICVVMDLYEVLCWVVFITHILNLVTVVFFYPELWGVVLFWFNQVFIKMQWKVTA